MPHELDCSICKQIFCQPCTIGNNECIHVFCRICIEKWQSMGQAQQQEGNNQIYPTCPMCRRQIKKITKNLEKEREIHIKTPLNIYKQRQIEDDALESR